MQEREHTQCLIIGSGPAGYTAAIYASRANLSPVEYCGLQTGGQLTQTTVVENFPGYPEGVDGNQMMLDLRAQAERLGTDIRDGEIVKADLSKRPYVLTTDEGKEIEADTVIIATGASAKYLGLEDEKKYNGQGVSACATCDGFFYRKRTVAVVGGGDTACEEALYLAGLAKKVYMTTAWKAPISSNARENPMRSAMTCPSTASSSPSATSPTPTSSRSGSTPTRQDTSSPSTVRRAPNCPVSSPPATWPTPTTGKPSQPLPAVARPR